MKYLSAIISIALTCALLLTELYLNNTNHIAEHAIMGCLISTLFLLFCAYGLEMINWVVLASIPILFLVAWLTTSEPLDSEDCDCLDTPENEKPCPKREPTKCEKEKRRATRSQYEHVNRPECPARPIDLRTQCGVTRFS